MLLDKAVNKKSIERKLSTKKFKFGTYPCLEDKYKAQSYTIIKRLLVIDFKKQIRLIHGLMQTLSTTAI